MGTDPFPPGGVQALWPFGREYYMSGWDFFPPTERDFANPQLWIIDGKALVVRNRGDGRRRGAGDPAYAYT